MPQPDSKKYKIRARGLRNCPDQSTCRLEISVGQPYHEGSKLEAALNWAERFSSVSVIVCDEPQRFNIAFRESSPLQQAWDKARQQGEAWIARNRTLLEQHRRFDVIRWPRWKESPNYEPAREEAGRLYGANDNFKVAIDKAMRAVFDRNGYPAERYVDFKALSTEYLLEETAVLSLAFDALRGFSAYPGTFLDIWAMFAGKDIKGPLAGLSNAYYTKLEFVR